MNVCGSGADLSWVEAAAVLLGGNICECPPNWSATNLSSDVGHDIALVLADPSEETLAGVIAGSVKICYALDIGFDIHALRGLHASFAAAPLMKGLCLSARCAYDLPVGSTLADALSNKLCLSARTRLNIDIALSEAVANALIHGCLNLNSPKERFDPVFVSSIEDRIRQPDYGSRPIWIAVRHTADGSLSILVADEGAGFETNDTPPALDDPATASRGRGLIHSAADEVAYTDHGRCLEMKFSL